jgi:ketosteroid isomerase-like protein
VSENLDLVRSIYAAQERGDFRSADWADPDVEWVTVDGPAPGRWTGLAGMAEGWREFLSAWGNYSAVAEEYRELDSERVLVLIRQSGRGKTSGIDLAQMHARVAAIFHIRDGRVVKVVNYMDVDLALVDLGLKDG